MQGGTAGPIALHFEPDDALYFTTRGGATKASPDNAVVRIVWKP